MPNIFTSFCGCPPHCTACAYLWAWSLCGTSQHFAMNMTSPHTFALLPLNMLCGLWQVHMNDFIVIYHLRMVMLTYYLPSTLPHFIIFHPCLSIWSAVCDKLIWMTSSSFTTYQWYVIYTGHFHLIGKSFRLPRFLHGAYNLLLLSSDSYHHTGCFHHNVGTTM